MAKTAPLSSIRWIKNVNEQKQSKHSTISLVAGYETPICCLKSDKTNGYMWAISSADNGSTLHFWQNSRSAEALNHLLRHGMQPDGRVYEGAILSDGYGGYESWMKTLPDEQKPQWQVCWAHVRRKFVEAAGNSNNPAWSMKGRTLAAIICNRANIARE